MIARWLLDVDPGRLPAEHVDVLIVGAGVAGLSTALELPRDRSVLLVTRGRLAQSATRCAQGGIAAVPANLLQLATVLVRTVSAREESRGAHRRSDYPVPVDAWRVRQAVTRAAGGHLEAARLPVPEAEEARR